MSAYGVTFCEDAAHRGRIRVSHFTDEKERRLHALSGENVEDLIGIARHWSIIVVTQLPCRSAGALPRDPLPRRGDILAGRWRARGSFQVRRDFPNNSEPAPDGPKATNNAVMKPKANKPVIEFRIMPQHCLVCDPSA